VARPSIHTFEYQLLAHRLRRARERAGYTQVQVAETLGRPQSYISKAETGERRLDVLELLEFLRLYDVSITRFLSPRLNPDERTLQAKIESRLRQPTSRRAF
jgi:transcriptional regulator with XRE-family HTH domain